MKTLNKTSKSDRQYSPVYRLILIFVLLLINVVKSLAYRFANRCSNEGWRYLIGLVLILVLFTVVKYPYFNNSFTGVHTMKYNTHVESAYYMFERNDPFWNQQKYRADPVNNPQGIRSTFSSPPIIEWGVLATLNLFPKNSLEFNTRLFMHSLGLTILLLSYIFFSKWFTKTESLLITFLIAVNPIINFLSFVTVEDSLLIICTFLSLIYLTKYINNNSVKDLFLTGVFFGIGNANKVSIFLWLAPIIFIILVFHNKKLSFFLRDYGLIIVLSLVSIIAYRTSLANLPSDATGSIIKFAAWIIGYYFIYYLIERKRERINCFFEKVIYNKWLFGAVLGITIISGIVFINYSGIYRLAEEFLTDSTLIFYWDMYDHMLNTQFKSYMTTNLFYLGLIGFIFIFTNGNREHKIILFAFLAGSFIYWVLASKAMFFHNYYTGIVMITFAVSVGLMFYLLSKLLRSIPLGIISFLIMFWFVVPDSYSASVSTLSYERPNLEDLQKVAQYLIDNTEENEIYIDDSYLLTLTFMTGRARIEEFNLDNNTIRNSIREIGFSNTMEKYNVACLVTSGNDPRYERYVNLFIEERIDSVAYRRSDIIKSSLDSKYSYFQDIEIRREIIESEGIRDKFILVQEFGSYKIFVFND